MWGPALAFILNKPLTEFFFKIRIQVLYCRTYYAPQQQQQPPIDHIVSPLSPYQWMTNDGSGGDGIPFTAG